MISGMSSPRSPRSPSRSSPQSAPSLATPDAAWGDVKAGISGGVGEESSKSGGGGGGKSVDDVLKWIGGILVSKGAVIKKTKKKRAMNGASQGSKASDNTP